MSILGKIFTWWDGATVGTLLNSWARGERVGGVHPLLVLGCSFMLDLEDAPIIPGRRWENSIEPNAIAELYHMIEHRHRCLLVGLTR